MPVPLHAPSILLPSNLRCDPQATAWRRQCLPCSSPPGAFDALKSTRELHQHGSLHTGLVQPSLNIKRKGRPNTDKNKNAEAVRRATTFLEDLKACSAGQQCLTEETVGAAAVRNPGGKGTRHKPPTCSLCGERGHKITQCTKQVCPNVVQTQVSASSSHKTSASGSTETAGVQRTGEDVEEVGA